MNLKIYFISALFTSLISCSAMDPTSPRLRRDANHAIAPKEQRRMDRLEKHAFLSTECKLPAGSVIITRLTSKTVLDERDDETYNLAHVLGGKKEFVFAIENRVIAALKRHYTALVQQEVFRQDQVQGLVDFHKQKILTVLLQDYPEIIQEFQKLWAEETKVK